MKILITAIFFPPQNAIASQRPYVWARTWARLGHSVTVLTVSKDEMRPDLSRKSFKGFEVIETSPGHVLKILRSKRRLILDGHERPQMMEARGFRVRVFDWLRNRGVMSSVRLPDAFDLWLPTAAIYVAKHFRSMQFEVIVSTFGPHASLAAGYFVKRVVPSAKWVIDFRDLWTENHVYPGFWPLTMVEKVLERFYLRKCDGITTVSEALASALRVKIPGKPIFVSKNGFDPEEALLLNPSKGKYRSKLTFVYTGSLHQNQRNPAVLFQAVQQLSAEERSGLEIVFAGPLSEFLRDLVGRFHLYSHVRVLGPLSRDESIKIQHEADVLLFLEKQHDESRDGVLTGKLFEYLVTGRPIWAIGIDNTTTVGRLIEGGSAGVALGCDVDAIVKQLRLQLSVGRSPSRDTQDSNDVSRRYNRESLAIELMEWISAL